MGNTTAIQSLYQYSNLWQPKESFKFYSTVIDPRYNSSGNRNIVIVKVKAVGYQSDPDVYVSQTIKTPIDSSTSTWQCDSYGSETCILSNSQFTIGDTFYFGVKCVQECTYNLKVYYTGIIQVNDTQRQQIRFESFSTNILSYFVPSESNGVSTSSVEFTIQPEKDFSPVQAYLSLDQNFNMFNYLDSGHIINGGVAIKFGQADEQDWCTKCLIYIIVNVEQDQRYFISAAAKSINLQLQLSPPQEVLVNTGTQQCFLYNVQVKAFDLRFDVEGYTGISDIYVAVGRIPEGPNARVVYFRGASAAGSSIILQSADKNAAGALIGAYYLCFYAYSPFSGRVTTTETFFYKKFDSYDGVQQTQILRPRGDFFYSRYSNNKFKQRGKISVYLNEIDGLTPPEIYYQICTTSFAYCVLSDTQLNNTALISSSFISATGTLERGARTATINHVASACPLPDSCTYIFFFQNNLPNNTVRLNLRIQSESYNPTELDLDTQYLNYINLGEYINYQIRPAFNPVTAPQLSKLKIKLFSIQGDADLFVSFKNPNPNALNHDYSSRDTEVLSQIELSIFNNPDIFKSPIYIGIFGDSKAQFKIQFEYELTMSQTQLINTAQLIGERSFLSQTLQSYGDEALYAFQPWWDQQENRTIVFLADAISNSIQFFCRYNDDPTNILASIRDVNNIISLYGDNVNNYNKGTYYIRLRPDFALYGLISKREYIYNIYAFSMSRASSSQSSDYQFENIVLGQTYYGFSNQSKYQDYKFLQIDTVADYEISVVRIPGMGSPSFYVNLVEQAGDLQLPRQNTAQFRSIADQFKPKSGQILMLTRRMLSKTSQYCDLKVSRSLQSNGEQKCFLAISVLCGGGSFCAYKLNIQQIDSTLSGTQITGQQSQNQQPIPAPIFDNEFVNGQVQYLDTNYYYLPFKLEDVGATVIFLQKKQIYGAGQNGDSYLLANIQDQTNQLNYKSWTYPTESNSFQISRSNSTSTAEIIGPSADETNSQCTDIQKGCTFVLGVKGLTSGALSSYRLKAFRAYNRLVVNAPFVKQISTSRQGRDAYDYYWFHINEQDDNIWFEYQISVAAQEGCNPDLFVSVKDGRFPTDQDNDFSSKLIGADSIKIASNDTFWQQNKISNAEGVLVVVAVKQVASGNYTLILTTPKASPGKIDRLLLGQIFETQLDRVNDTQRSYTHVFQYFNWFHRSVELSFQVSDGVAQIFYQATGQFDFKQNIYTAIPINSVNSRISQNSSASQPAKIQIRGGKCFQCWHFFTINITNPNSHKYSLKLVQSGTGDQNITAISVDRAEQRLVVPGNTQVNRKFVVNSTTDLILQAQVGAGQVEIYIGLDLALTGPSNYTWMAKTSGGLALVSIKQTDKNFQVGTTYYVLLKSVTRTAALINLQLIQQRRVNFLQNNYDFTYRYRSAYFNDILLYRKFQFQNLEELVKYHAFRVPGKTGNSSQPQYYKVKITIDALTPNFYPLVYLKKNEVQVIQQGFKPSMLPLPSINDYDLEFGQNILTQINTARFEYTFYNDSKVSWAFWTMAIYQNNWGLSDSRKSEYQIQIQADRVEMCEAIPCDSNLNPVVRNSLLQDRSNTQSIQIIQ